MLNAVTWDEDNQEFVAVEVGTAVGMYSTEFNEVKETDLLRKCQRNEAEFGKAETAYWENPNYCEADFENFIEAQNALDRSEYELYNHLSRISQENYEPEVSRVNDRCANIFWRGASDNAKAEAPPQRRTDTVLTLNGLKLYPGWYKNADRTYTYWFDNDSNVRYVLGVDRDELYIQVWHNRRSGGRWYGGFGSVEWFGSAYKDESEQKALLWLISHLDTVTRIDEHTCCTTPQVKTNPRGTRQWCTSCRRTWTV